MKLDEIRRRGFGMYSARYGNLYTARQLVQLFDRAHGDLQPLDRAWERPDGRLVDPFRPQIEPDGHATAAEVDAATKAHLADLRSVSEAGVAHVMRVFLQHYADITPVPALSAEAPDNLELVGDSPLLDTASAPAALAAIEREQRELDEIVCDEEAIDRHRSS